MGTHPTQGSKTRFPRVMTSDTIAKIATEESGDYRVTRWRERKQTQKTFPQVWPAKLMWFDASSNWEVEDRWETKKEDGSMWSDEEIIQYALDYLEDDGATPTLIWINSRMVEEPDSVIEALDTDAEISPSESTERQIAHKEQGSRQRERDMGAEDMEPDPAGPEPPQVQVAGTGETEDSEEADESEDES